MRHISFSVLWIIILIYRLVLLDILQEYKTGTVSFFNKVPETDKDNVVDTGRSEMGLWGPSKWDTLHYNFTQNYPFQCISLLL